MERKLVAIIFLFISGISFSQKKVLKYADSLFQNQKYTEAYEVYDELFRSGQSSAAILLKMAFIKDGLGDYVHALYYLDIYYTYSADRSVVAKIKKIAEGQGLRGYQYDDRNFFAALVEKYELYLQLVCAAIVLMLWAYILRKKKGHPFTAGAFQLLFMGVLIFLSNDLYTSDKGIILSDRTLLRSGPSAGAEPIRLIEKGHKVEILESGEEWVKIRWGEDEVFVRNSRVKII